VFVDFVTAVMGNTGHEGFEFVTSEIFDTPALLAKEQMVVSRRPGDKRLAAVGVVDSLNGPQFFQFFQGAVNGHKSQAGTIRPGEVVYVGRAEGPRGGVW
jgi:hypothetical protein